MTKSKKQLKKEKGVKVFGLSTERDMEMMMESCEWLKKDKKTNMTQKEISWEEETKWKISQMGWFKEIPNDFGQATDCLQDIVNLLSQARREEREEITEWAEEQYKFAKTTKQFMAVSGTDVGYNNALDDLLTNLKNK